MEIKERLQLILTQEKINATQFAEKLNIQRSSISHILSGRNKPSMDFLEKLCLHFPNIDLHWLVTGKNQTDKKDETFSKNFNSPTQENLSKEKTISKIITVYSDNTFEILEPMKK
jgi:transcriptional regulator with XRE-family HTH domain